VSCNLVERNARLYSFLCQATCLLRYFRAVSIKINSGPTTTHQTGSPSSPFNQTILPCSEFSGPWCFVSNALGPLFPPSRFYLFAKPHLSNVNISSFFSVKLFLSKRLVPPRRLSHRCFPFNHGLTVLSKLSSRLVRAGRIPKASGRRPRISPPL